MKDKKFHLSFSSEVENKDEWKKAILKEDFLIVKSGIASSDIVLFIGDKINKEDWNYARSFKKLIYNLTGLEVEGGIGMLKTLLNSTDWERV